MTPIPSARQTVVEQGESGRMNFFSRPWYLFMQAVSTALAATSADPTPIVVGASPFTQAAANDGVAIVSGGTVSLIEYGRNAVFTNLGVIAGEFFMFAGDSLRITYTVVPTVNFIRR